MTDLTSLATAAVKRLIQPTDDNNTINLKIEAVATALRAARINRLLVAQIAPGVELAWSGRGKDWRFVIREREAPRTHAAIPALVECHVTNLLDTSLAERTEAFSSGAMEAIVRQIMKPTVR